MPADGRPDHLSRPRAGDCAMKIQNNRIVELTLDDSHELCSFRYSSVESRQHSVKRRQCMRANESTRDGRQFVCCRLVVGDGRARATHLDHEREASTSSPAGGLFEKSCRIVG
jgi:hypothetical protein